MGERSDGRWASKFIGMSAPRQNGKSQIIVARALAGVLLFGEKTIIISAHETDTAREVWRRLIDIVESNPSVEARVTARMNAVNRESLTFGVGQDKQVIKLKARSATGSRGFSADCLLLDEAQILGKTAWGSIVPTMSARPNPQLWLFGTPPTATDDPFAFARVRESAMAKRARHTWLEWAAEPGDDFDDPETWAKANPSFGVRISAEACADDRAAMDDDQFALERLGMWAPPGQTSIIPSAMWDAAGDESSIAVDRFSLGVEVAPDMARASVSFAGLRADGDWHIELDEARDGAAWVVPYVKALLAENSQVRGVGVDAGSPAKALLDDFEAAGVRVITPKVTDLGGACAQLLSGVVDRSVHHIRQGHLTAAVAGAGKRKLGDTGLWVWHRSSAAVDITPVQAATLALWVARLDRIYNRPLRQRRQGSSGRRAVIL